MAPPADEEQEMKTPGALKLSDPEEQASESDNFPVSLRLLYYIDIDIDIL